MKPCHINNEPSCSTLGMSIFLVVTIQTHQYLTCIWSIIMHAYAQFMKWIGHTSHPVFHYSPNSPNYIIIANAVAGTYGWAVPQSETE